MSLETETVLDRRRLRRQVSLWRTLAVVAVVATVATLAYVGNGAGGLTDRRQIARITVSGMITEDRDVLKMLDRIAKAGHVAGVIVDINSPGGTTTGGEALFEGIRRVAETKPVVAQFGTVAASAAYITGLACDHIVARGNTITGSVGVIVQWPEFSQLLDKLGVKINEVKSGPLKAVPSPYQPLQENARKLTEEMVADSQSWFLSLVASRRAINPLEVPGLTDGRIYSGREALRLKLVDEIGGEPEAIKWLVERRNVPKGLKVVDWKPKRDDAFSWVGALAGLAGAAGVWSLGDVASQIGADRLGVLALDGLVSVWHPAKN